MNKAFFILSAYSRWVGYFPSAVTVINPRRACAARVTVVGSVCLSVCLLSHISPTERLFVLKTLSCTQPATKVKKFVGICLKLLCSRVLPRNMSEKDHYANFSDLPAVSFLRLTYSEAPEVTQRLSTTFSLAQNDAYCCLYPVLERELTAPLITAKTRGVANFCARALG